MFVRLSLTKNESAFAFADKPMANHLFPNFLCDPADYATAERYWLDLWSNLNPHEVEARGWKAGWITTTFADGTPMRDGNPIFSAISEKEGRAIRVIQFAPQEASTEFDYWLGIHGAGNLGSPDAIAELVIACALSDQAAATAQLLMNAWIVGHIQFRAEGGELRVVPSRLAG